MWVIHSQDLQNSFLAIMICHLKLQFQRIWKACLYLLYLQAELTVFKFK